MLLFYFNYNHNLLNILIFCRDLSQSLLKIQLLFHLNINCSLNNYLELKIIIIIFLLLF
jgi:hypothetical protein